MNFIRCKEIEREKERREHIACVKCLGTFILRHRRRGKSPNILSVLKFGTEFCRL